MKILKGLFSLLLVAVGAIVGYYYALDKVKDTNTSSTNTNSGGAYISMSPNKNTQFTRTASSSDFENVQMVFTNGSNSVAISLTPTSDISGLTLKITIYDKEDKAIESFSRAMGDVIKNQTISFTVTMSDNGTTAGRGIYKTEIYVTGGKISY